MSNNTITIHIPDNDDTQALRDLYRDWETEAAVRDTKLPFAEWLSHWAEDKMAAP